MCISVVVYVQTDNYSKKISIWGKFNSQLVNNLSTSVYGVLCRFMPYKFHMI